MSTSLPPDPQRLSALLAECDRLLQAERAARTAAADAVEALRTQEERFEAMVDGAFDFIGLTTPDGRLLEANHAALEFAGVSRQDVVGRLFWDTPWWAHDATQRARLQLALTRAAEGHTDAFEATHRAADGRVAVVDFATRGVQVVQGRARYVVVEGRDITHRRDAERALSVQVTAQAGQLAAIEEALQESQALYRAVAETIVDGLVVIDTRGRIEWVNRAVTRIFGYEASELVGRNVSTLMPASRATEHDGYLARYLATGERKIIGQGREVEGRRKDGTEFPLYLGVSETNVHGLRKFTGIVRDLTGRKQLEQQLQERQTLARIGELAAVVAHEVRNPLAAIRGVVEVVQTRFPPESSDRKVLGDLLLRVDALDQLVSDLLVYARPTPPVYGRVAALELARQTATLAAQDPAATALRFDVVGDEADVHADPAQLGRALLNLLTNAAQAMRYEGTVRVRGVREGDRYHVVVEDDGPGMAPDVAAQCLEPFFTTKTRGTGLGLPIARRIVEEHGGTLTVTSREGDGTRVALDLPLAAS